MRGVFMGNTAERVLGTIEASVLAVKPRGFETPIVV
jgi:nucleotide-binding universal stress UspA family protein